MSLSEVEFAYFLPVFLLIYWLGPRKASYQNAILIAGGLFFYATWSLRLLPLFVGSTLLDYALLRGMGKGHALAAAAREQGATDEDALSNVPFWLRPKTLLALGVLHNLGALVTFKYLGFFADAANHTLGTHLPVLRIALPLGISFYTMGRLGVLIDTYYERLPPVPSLAVWGAFVSFFPQLIAGPIGRGSELFDQYSAPRKPEPEAVLKAIGELSVGFLLKVYVAAQVGLTLVDPVFLHPGTFSRKAHWLALFGYATQVFADFAGYSLIAIAVGRLLGITLPDNFNAPFLSVSPPEVWRRWHMTLNRWLFDYLYGPWVTGDSLLRGQIGLGFVLVMAISGLWHGAAWTFLVWGVSHGLWLWVHHRYDLFYKSLCRKDKAWVKRRKTAAYQLAGWVLTIGFFTLTLVPFRATSLAGAGQFLKGLVAGGPESIAPGTVHPFLAVLIVAVHQIWQHPRLEGLRERMSRVPFPVRGVTVGALVVFLFLFAPVGAGTFIYAQF